METLGVVLVSVFVPIVWGFVSAWAFDRWNDRRQRTQVQDCADDQTGAR